MCCSTRRGSRPGSSSCEQDNGALPTSLPLIDSLVLAWWQLVVLIALAVVMFAAAYMSFMRQEVRA